MTAAMAVGEVTAALAAWRAGGAGSEEALARLVYADLRRRAARLLARERPDHTLQPTALVHEAYLRLLGQAPVDWQGRTHFFAFAARLMRQVLTDHARRRGAEKRGGGAVTVSLDAAGEVAAEAVDFAALDEALGELAGFDPRGAQVVELRFFGGLTVDETAVVLACSPATVHRLWQVARAWLFQRLAAR